VIIATLDGAPVGAVLKPVGKEPSAVSSVVRVLALEASLRLLNAHRLIGQNIRQVEKLAQPS
jgi:hypothetical protein